MNSKNRNTPTHRVFAVTQSDGRSFWREIGAAWTHSDGEGLNLKIDYLPLNGAEIVVRKPIAAADQPGPDDEADSGTRRNLSSRAKAPEPSPT